MKALNNYLALANNGNASAALEAAKIMYQERYNEVMVQAMLRKAAELGEIRAQRWLGFIGLADRLIDPHSTTSRITYRNGAAEAYKWFKKAAIAGDAISAFAVCKCLEYGIGVSPDPVRASKISSMLSFSLTPDILTLMFFFDTYHNRSNTTQSPETLTELKDLLAG